MFDVAFCVYRGGGQKGIHFQIVRVTQDDTHISDYGKSISPQRLADNDSSKEHIVIVDVQLC